MQKEKCVLVFLYKESETPSAERRIHEFRSIVESSGGEVCAVIVQKKEHWDARTLIGKGKVQEIQDFIDANAVDLVIFEAALTGAQRKNLMEIITAKVLDRNDLILDIFAQRARTKRSKLNVSLAQLEYRLPRLKGYGDALSRTGGGIGTRGPGEQKIETDRRAILSRISAIRRQLREIEKTEKTASGQRRRSGIPTVSLVGYTNAGKSTILNALVRKYGEKAKEVYADDRLFATLDIHTRRIHQTGEGEYLLTDTIGFIYDLPKKLTDAFLTTLDEARKSSLLLVVLDASDENLEKQRQTVLTQLAEMADIPKLFIYNKMDQRVAPIAPDREPWIAISAQNEDDIFRLQETILKILYGPVVEEKRRIPCADSKIIQYLHRWGRVTDQETDEKGNLVNFRIRKKLIPKFFQEDEDTRIIPDAALSAKAVKRTEKR
ncbi:MAG: GTPase HflX [Peptoniphilaceae bacterium]|nr:GTPase HflX [Peptoniphilaceae bacterium]MDY5765750.1 GTPase HflX [Peptoniphilaceae bacterium]